MGTVISLLAGVGLVCVWSSFWEPAPTPPRRRRLDTLMRDRLTQAGMHGLSPLAFILISLAFAGVAWLFGLALTGSVAVSTALGLGIAALPTGYVSHTARKRRTNLATLWPEVIDDLISAIRAGMSLPDALSALATNGPPALREYFAAFSSDLRATGRFVPSLDRLKHRLADPVADRIVEALRITRDVGGTELTTLLGTLGTFLREDLRTRSELVARQSWTTGAARLAALAPWIVLALLSTQSETAQAFDSPLGVSVLVAGAAVSAVAYWMMVRLGRLPEEARVLR